MLSLKSITKQYGKVTALDDVSLDFEHRIYALLGLNGSGKSTLMSLVCGLLSPNEGEILYNDTNIKKLGVSYTARLGYMPQYPGMYPSFSVHDFLCYLSELKGLPKNNREEINCLLRRVELDDVADSKISTLSGGMKQRLALAGAVLGSPEIIILDEPTAGLDPAQRIAVRTFMSEIAKDKTVIWATHIVSDIEHIANKIVFLKKGKVVDITTPDDIRKSGTTLEDHYMSIFGDIL